MKIDNVRCKLSSCGQLRCNALVTLSFLPRVGLHAKVSTSSLDFFESEGLGQIFSCIAMNDACAHLNPFPPSRRLIFVREEKVERDEQSLSLP